MPIEVGPERFDEIVDFAGIGDFVELPMNTYSSGMAARLPENLRATIRAGGLRNWFGVLPDAHIAIAMRGVGPVGGAPGVDPGVTGV